MLVVAGALADEPPPRDASLREVIGYYPVARGHVDTLRFRMATLRHDLTDEQTDHKADVDTLRQFLWQANFRADVAEALHPAWHDRFLPGFIVGVAATVLLVWGMTQL